MRAILSCPPENQPVRTTVRPSVLQLDKAAKALPEASRRAEDRLRGAFFAEVGTVLASLGAAPALRAPKKLLGDAGVCLRYGGVLPMCVQVALAVAKALSGGLRWS